jgi:hypothetical protein
MVGKNINELLKLAIAHDKAGELEKGEFYYQKILKDIHGHGDANYNLGYY